MSGKWIDDGVSDHPRQGLLGEEDEEEEKEEEKEVERGRKGRRRSKQYT